MQNSSLHSHRFILIMSPYALGVAVFATWGIMQIAPDIIELAKMINSNTSEGIAQVEETIHYNVR